MDRRISSWTALVAAFVISFAAPSFAQDPGSARVLLGIAYLKKQQPEQAREAFAAVDANSEWRDLAELWSLRALAVERS